MRHFFLTLAALCWFTPVLATDMTNLSEDERTSFRNEVRAYLLDNPEVLMEAIAVLEQRQRDNQAQGDQALISAYSDEIFDDGYSYVGGNPNGDITLVEFLDYRCTYCRKAHAEVTELVKSDGNIRYVIKELPILGEQSLISSKLAVATLQKAGPDAYLTLHNFLMTYNGNLNPNVMSTIMKKIVADADPVMSSLEDPAVLGQIQSVSNLAQKLQITGTPTFILGNEMIRGYLPLANMRDLVAVAREAKN